MDPDALIQDILQGIDGVLGVTGGDPTAVGLAENVEDLFTWLRNGGFQPDWSKA